MQAALEDLRATAPPRAASGSTRRTGTAGSREAVGRTPCRDAQLWHYTSIFNGLNHAGASHATIRAVGRTLGVVTSFGALNGYFGAVEPFASVAQKEIVLKKARKKAVGQAEDDSRYLREYCPGPRRRRGISPLLWRSSTPGTERAWCSWPSVPVCASTNCWRCAGTPSTYSRSRCYVDWQIDRYGNWPDCACRSTPRRVACELLVVFAEVAATSSSTRSRATVTTMAGCSRGTVR